MTLIEYLEIISTIINNYLRKLDELYIDCKFSVDKLSTQPMGFIFLPDNGLNIVLNKNVFDPDLRDNGKIKVYSPFSKPILGDKYYSTEYGFYTYNEKALINAINIGNKMKIFLQNIINNISFYIENKKITLNFCKINSTNSEYIIEIKIGEVGAIHILFNINRRYFEVLENYNPEYILNIIKNMKIPEEKIPTIIKEYIEKDSSEIIHFTKDELLVYKYNDGGNTRRRK